MSAHEQTAREIVRDIDGAAWDRGVLHERILSAPCLRTPAPTGRFSPVQAIERNRGPGEEAAR